MPAFTVRQPHSLPVDDAKTRLGGFSETLAKYGVRLEWDGPRARLAGVPGVGGHVHVRSAEVEVVVDVSRMLTLMGLDPTRLEGTVRRRLSDALG